MLVLSKKGHVDDKGTDGGSTGGGTTGCYGGYFYNDNGELTSVSKDSGITTFSRDNLGQLKEVNVNSGKLISYALDWDGRRVAKSIDGVVSARNIYEGSLQLSAVVAQDGSIKEYVYGTNINSPDYMKVGAATFRIIKDHLGSPRLVVNVTDGTISQRMDYNEWGEVLVDTNPGFQGFGFAGGLYDPDTKLVKFGARDYDPSVGRWLSKDPILFAGGDANLYGYVLQDPVNFIDPFGEYEMTWGGSGGGAGIGDLAIAASIGMCFQKKESSEHTKNKRKSTKNKHEKGQKRKNQKNTDKKRQKDDWYQR